MTWSPTDRRTSPMRIRRLAEEADEHHLEPVPVTASRRRFMRDVGLGGAAALGAAAVPVAVLSSSASAQSGGSTPVELSSSDATFVEFAIGVELAVAMVYTDALDRQLLEPEATELARSFGNHHHEHALTLATLAGRDEETIGFPDPAILGQFGPRIAAATSADALLAVLFEIEQSMAATYADALGTLESPDAAGPAGSILPVESQHATAIGSSLELPTGDWMPAFQTTEGAFTPATAAD
jgi:hypothetical protein